MHVQGILPARCSRSQHVQAHARDDRREPGPQVVDAADIGAAQPNPAFLDGVLGVAGRPEHAIRDRAQMRPVLFELLGEPFRCGHRSHSSVAVRHGSDGRNVADVTERAPYARLKPRATNNLGDSPSRRDFRFAVRQVRIGRNAQRE